ncbi:UNVERIFIED_CONTAM: Calmodulin binding protein PICBP [Sesamum latifolium]|uniref:Calmodulin binding protein PICBP n=1 Tax=Sesamum latifolium TaxID=2727402 RepID=A0AAW2XGI6_9LAMI
MAGMQYYFFPTDFYYPKPPPPHPADHDTSHVQNRQVLPMVEHPVGETDVAVRKNVVLKVPALRMVIHVPPTRKPARCPRVIVGIGVNVGHASLWIPSFLSTWTFPCKSCMIPSPRQTVFGTKEDCRCTGKSMIPETESRPGATQSSNKHKNRPKTTQIVPIVGDGSRVENENGLEFYGEREAQLFGNGHDEILESGLLEIAFGETSFPERSYTENLDILRKYSSPEQEFGGTNFLVNGYCLRCICQCHIKEQVWSKDEIPENENTDVSDTSSSASTEDTANQASNRGCPETPLTPSERQRSIDCNGDEEGGITTESTSYGDSRGNEAAEVKDSETNSPTDRGGKLRFSRRSHMSMWQLIHQHMSANLVAAESAEKQLQGFDGESPVDGSVSLPAKESSTSGRELADSHKGTVKNDSEVQDIEDHKLFAIKLVREAIEKVLLPEVQDQASDDNQSITGKNAPPPELGETNQSEVCMQENFGETDAHRDDNNVLCDLEEESHITDDDSGQEIKGTDDDSGQGIKETDDASGQEITENNKKVVSKSGKKAPKNWSNLKKWILLQRFIRELEKVTKLNARKPRPLALNPGPEPEAEKVNLRPQTADGKKNAEEWMLDYALRQAVCQLAPTQKRKVALLVKGFEQVVPTQEEPQLQLRIPRIKSNGSDISSTSYKADHSVSESSLMFQRSVDERTGKLTSIMKSVLPSSEEENPTETAGGHIDANVVPKSENANGNIKSEGPELEKEEASLTAESLILDVNGKSEATVGTNGPVSLPESLEKEMGEQTEKEAIPTAQRLQEDATSNRMEGQAKDGGQSCSEMDRKNHIKMWHKIYKHVVSNIVERVGNQLLDGADDDEVEDSKSPTINTAECSKTQPTNDSSEKNHVPSNLSGGFTKSDALKLIKQAVDEILQPEIQDDSSDTQSVTSEEGQNFSSEDGVLIDGEGQSWMHDSVSTQDETKAESKVSKESHEQPKAKNWGKLKKLILLKRSIKALEKARRLKPQPQEPEKNETKRQMTDERRKAEKWMLDYAVQHIVTKLTPARKQRVSMLVEAFEAVIPFPEM